MDTPCVTCDVCRFNTYTLTADLLERLIIEEKYTWNTNLCICSKKDDVVMMEYCIDRGANHYISALSYAWYNKAYKAITLLVKCCLENIDHNLELICEYAYVFTPYIRNHIDIIILLLNASDKINLSPLKSIIGNSDELFNIIMTKPFDITRNHFHIPKKSSLWSRLNEYNSYILTDLKLFMCDDMASVVSSYIDM